MNAESWLEVIIPVRNPGAKLLETVDSLVAQTTRNFCVLCSDNYSTRGLDFLEEARRRLESAGIRLTITKPLQELGRVEHWNWVHFRATASWLKPLFVGDLLAPEYVKTLKARTEQVPASQIVRCDFTLVFENGRFTATPPAGVQRSLTPQEFLSYYPRHGNWLGGPVNFAYTRLAWASAGGYDIHLPACADINLFVAMILRSGLELLPETLATFQLHEDRFSKGIARRRVNGLFELWITLREARNYCLSVGIPWPSTAIPTGLWRQAKTDYLAPLKARFRNVSAGAK